MLTLMLIVLITATTGEEIYENSTNLCQRCTCTNSKDLQILNLNCNDQDFHYILGDWPPHNATLKATFIGNNITTLQALPSTDAVVEVTFAKCNIQHLYPDLFTGTKNIKMVDFSYNLLTADEFKSGTFAGPYHDTTMEPIKLEELNLAYNQIHTLSKNLFKFLPKLKRLNLEGNDFVVLDIHTQLALSSLRNLASLNLANNELTELVKDAIVGPKHLVELNLARNRLDFVPESLVTVGGSLEILILDDNPILEFTNETFTGLENLSELSANNLLKLKHVNASTFATMAKLNKLNLSGNSALQDIDRDAFSKNQTIKELYLNNNNLHHIDYELLQWSHLRVFEFYENPLVCSCDLYNITGALSGEITRTKAGPFCIDPRTERFAQVNSLTGDICSAKIASKNQRILRYHFSVPVAGLVATLILALTVAVGLAFNRYRRFLHVRNVNSQVFYNPLPTSSARF